jgi:hypothetical protein
MIEFIKGKFPSVHIKTKVVLNNMVDISIMIEDGGLESSINVFKETKDTVIVLTKQDYYVKRNIEELSNNGYIYCKETSDLSMKNYKTSVKEGEFYIFFFKKIKFFKPLSQYIIQGVNTENESHKISFRQNNAHFTSLQSAFIDIIDFIQNHVEQQKSVSIVRASDGDYCFLRMLTQGSAKPGKRAITKEYRDLKMDIFYNLFWDNEISIEVEKESYKLWHAYLFYERVTPYFKFIGLRYDTQNWIIYKIFRLVDKMLFPFITSKWCYLLMYRFSKRKSEKKLKIINRQCFPSETIYALVSSKWIFKKYKKIGIIASKEKMSLIKELMTYEEYRQYLSCKGFDAYIEIPQIGAADNVMDLSQKISQKIRESNAQIFLIGAGSAKLALLPLLKQYSNAVFLDVGIGIDAIAGIVCQERPFFADWINYRIASYDYSQIDFLDQGNKSWKMYENQIKYLN